jgi:hypothetical protein
MRRDMNRRALRRDMNRRRQCRRGEAEPHPYN